MLEVELTMERDKVAQLRSELAEHKSAAAGAIEPVRTALHLELQTTKAELAAAVKEAQRWREAERAERGTERIEAVEAAQAQAAADREASGARELLRALRAAEERLREGSAAEMRRWASEGEAVSAERQ